HNTQALVKDSDLQLACNALWSEGAEAIAVNGQRLTATSTIRQAGEAILVDFRPVTTPYEVVAIGPDTLAEEVRGGYAGRFFGELAARYGMSVDAAEVKDVTLDAATDLTLRNASPSVPPASPYSSAASSAGPRAPREGARGSQSPPSRPVSPWAPSSPRPGRGRSSRTCRSRWWPRWTRCSA